MNICFHQSPLRTKAWCRSSNTNDDIPRLRPQAEYPSKRRAVFSPEGHPVASQQASCSEMRLPIPWRMAGDVTANDLSDAVQTLCMQRADGRLQLILSASGSLRFPTNGIYDGIKAVHSFVSQIFRFGLLFTGPFEEASILPLRKPTTPTFSCRRSSRDIVQTSNERSPLQHQGSGDGW